MAGRLVGSTGQEVELVDRVTIEREISKRKLLEQLGVPLKAAPSTPAKDDYGIGDIALNLADDEEEKKGDEEEDDYEDNQASEEVRKLLSARAKLKEKKDVVKELLVRVKQEEKEKEDERKRKRKELNEKKAKNYECPDTDPEEDYDDTPEYKRGREVLEATLEEKYLTKLPFGRQIVERG